MEEEKLLCGWREVFGQPNGYGSLDPCEKPSGLPKKEVLLGILASLLALLAFKKKFLIIW